MKIWQFAFLVTLFVTSCSNVVGTGSTVEAEIVLCHGEKVAVCHSSGPHQKTLCVAASALDAHLGHGDSEGACPDDQLCSVCGPGTIRVAGECVVENPLSCGPGTTEVNGECLPTFDPPTIRFDEQVTAIEGEPVQLVVELSSQHVFRVTVDYATSDGTAVAGADYVPALGTLIFEPGETSKLIEITIVDNVEIGSADRAFKLTFSNPFEAILDSDAALVTIVDDGDRPRVYGYVSSGTEGSIPTLNFVYWVIQGTEVCSPGGIPSTQFYPLAEPVTLTLGPPAPSQQSATWGQDFVTSGVVRIPSGQAFGQVPFGTIIDDDEVELLETVNEQFVDFIGDADFDQRCLRIRGFVRDND